MQNVRLSQFKVFLLAQKKIDTRKCCFCSIGMLHGRKYDMECTRKTVLQADYFMVDFATASNRFLRNVDLSECAQPS